MKNLAGVEACDDLVIDELERAGVDVDKRHYNAFSYNVPCRVYGTMGGTHYVDPDDEFMNRWVYKEGTLIKLNSFLFIRWSHFCNIRGYVPLHISEEMYSNSKGGNNIRARDATVPEEDGSNLPHENIACYKVAGMTVVRRHLIYTEESLDYFVETIENHNLV